MVVWAATGPIFTFSDWQLIINTGTTVITFLMVFLIQDTQNRNGGRGSAQAGRADRSVRGAHNAVLNLSAECEGAGISRAEYLRLAEQARSHFKKGRDQAEMGSSAASGKAQRKASTA